MSLITVREKLIVVKNALADKYDHLSKVVKSKPRRDSYIHHRDRFRRQALDLANLNKLAEQS
jgi:hypothetical protein